MWAAVVVVVVVVVVMAAVVVVGLEAAVNGGGDGGHAVVSDSSHSQLPVAHDVADVVAVRHGAGTTTDKRSAVRQQLTATAAAPQRLVIATAVTGQTPCHRSATAMAEPAPPPLGNSFKSGVGLGSNAPRESYGSGVEQCRVGVEPCRRGVGRDATLRLSPKSDSQQPRC